MVTIKAGNVRIPCRAKEAIARREQVVVIKRGRPAYVIAHPDDPAAGLTVIRGRPLREALALLAAAPPPDRGFAEDMDGVLRSIELS